MTTVSMRCPVCEGVPRPDPVYQGQIRHGKFGNGVEGRVFGCGTCGLQWLDSAVRQTTDYVSDAYRTLVGEDGRADTFFELHDDEQYEKLPLLRGIFHRGMTVADVGCGGGSFLDFVRGCAGSTVGIEPSHSYHDSLRSRGHRVASSVQEAAQEGVQADLVTCFSVIEHVSDPLELLQGLYAITKPDGHVLVSTPNLDDALLEAAPKVYQPFFYRTVHLHYFGAVALRRACEVTGLAVLAVHYHHRFGLANFLAWCRDGRPTGHATAAWLDDHFDATWRTELERRGRADYLYLVASRPREVRT